MTASQVFAALKRSTCFRPHLGAGRKWAILTAFWDERVEYFRQNFTKDGGEERDFKQGFGSLVEDIARRSPKFHKNTPAGAYLEAEILTALHTGDDSFVPVAGRRSNPDNLWLEMRGRRAEILALSEIKSSVGAVSKSMEQIHNLERSIRDTAERIAKAKSDREANDFFAKRKVVVRDPLRKILVVPAFEGNKIQVLPGGWEILEIEFTYEELVFISQQIWPDFRPDMKFEPRLTYVQKCRKEFLAKLVNWAGPKFDAIFAGGTGIEGVSTEGLLLFCLGTKQMVYLEDEAEFVSKEMLKFPFFRRHPQFLRWSQLDEWEKQFVQKTLKLFGGTKDQRDHVLYFLFCLREFKMKLESWCQKSVVRERVRSVMDLDIINTWN